MGLAGGARWHWRLCPLCVVAEATDPIHRSPFSHLFLFVSLFWSLLEHEVYKKHSSIRDLVKLMI